MAHIKRNVTSHLLALVNDILDLSKIQSGKFDIEITPFSLSALFSQLESTFSVSKDKGVLFTLEQEVEPKLKIWGDQNRIKQILLNLLSNAFKFTKQGEVLLRCWKEDQHLWFSVSDSGIGMSPEVLSRLFKPFEQGDNTISRRFGGTGLGLHISKSLVEMMDGEIRVSSRENSGSLFEFYLPYKESSLAVLNQEVEQETIFEPKRFKGTVLIVEDAPELQLLEKRILSTMGVEVTLVENGEKGVEQACQGVFDLILMDMQMPVMDGLEATREIRQQGVDTPIIGLTANVMQKHQDLFYKAGANGFLGKPIDKIALQKVLQCYLTEEEPLPVTPAVVPELVVKREAVGDHGCRRVLAVDDDEAVLELYQTIFFSGQNALLIEKELQELSDSGEASDERFDLVVADQGINAVELVRQGLKEGRPFPVAFIDMRMPPGISGLETAKELRKLDQRIYIVIVTAHSDVSLNEINRELKHGVLFIHKPFDKEELHQIAEMLTKSWVKEWVRKADTAQSNIV
ncbi:MAG: response regulator [Gammaproteobacteria bacterium]|nr:response regulator [Gammaproteobacteria bacterium]MBT4606766.1 response regulator [Thiotrichales bacterium]MBT4330084.1 response regulator [Gammaproteobacteria bacterium]MBT5372736.1 response regulator [Gammaproteobacteria bacterium]MBT5634658.1 response regulator [Gammaproteobacteria bacterium]